jgi:excisionase family DNA binding protein
MALSEQDIKAIGKEVLSVVEKCLKNITNLETTNANELLDMDQVSDKLRLGKQSIYRLIKEGQINAVKIGKSYFITTSDLNRYIKSKY